MNRRNLVLAGCALALAPLVATAQVPFPTKPIKVLIPFAAGGAVDTMIRAMGPELQAQLGQPIVVENKPGGGAQIAAASLMQSPADGYTVLAAEVGTFGVNPTLYPKLSYQPVRDFEGLAMLARAPMVMYGNPKGKVTSLQVLKDALAKGTPLTYGSFGPGTAPHLLGNQLAKGSTKPDLTHVPYKGAPPAFQAMMANEIDLLFDGVPGTLNMMRNGYAVPLAIAASKRSEFLPQVPTTAEIGYPAMSMDLWIGVVARKGTPPAIANALSAAFEKAITAPTVWKRFAELGFSRDAMTPAQFNAYIKAEIDRFRPIVQDSGASVD